MWNLLGFFFGIIFKGDIWMFVKGGDEKGFVIFLV